MESKILLGPVVLALVLAVFPMATAQPPGCYASGTHTFEFTDAQVTLETIDGRIDDIGLSGPTVVEATFVGDTDSDGLEELETEIVSMKLSGVSDVFGPVTLTESSTLASTGKVEQQFAATCFPADSHFDVFIQVEQPFPAHNDIAFRMEAVLDAIPPTGAGYRLAPSAPTIVPIFAGLMHPPPPAVDVHIGNITHAMHVPITERPVFSIAPGVAGTDPADLLMIVDVGRYAVVAPKELLGLQAGDDIDALSHGTDPIPDTRFSVRDGSLGLAGTAVREEATKAPAQALGDEFVARGGDNRLFMNEGIFGFFPGVHELDALAMDGIRGPEALFPIHFSLAAGSPTLAAIGAGPADILVSQGNGLPPIVDRAAAAMGLVAGDDIDALCFYPGVTRFSLAPGSPSLAAIPASAADVLQQGAPPFVALTDAGMGLDPGDDVDALKCGVPAAGGGGVTPPPSGVPTLSEWGLIILLGGLMGIGVIAVRRKG